MICIKNCSFQRISVRKLQSKNLRCLDRLLPLNLLLRTAPYSKPIRLSKEEEAHIPDSSKSNGIVRSPEKSPPRPLSVRRGMKRERKGRFTSGFIPLSVPSTHPVVENCAQLAACTMKDPKWSLCTLVVMKKLPEKSRKEL